MLKLSFFWDQPRLLLIKQLELVLKVLIVKSKLFVDFLCPQQVTPHLVNLEKSSLVLKRYIARCLNECISFYNFSLLIKTEFAP